MLQDKNPTILIRPPCNDPTGKDNDLIQKWSVCRTFKFSGRAPIWATGLAVRQFLPYLSHDSDVKLKQKHFGLNSGWVASFISKQGLVELKLWPTKGRTLNYVCLFYSDVKLQQNILDLIRLNNQFHLKTGSGGTLARASSRRRPTKGAHGYLIISIKRKQKYFWLNLDCISSSAVLHGVLRNFGPGPFQKVN